MWVSAFVKTQNGISSQCMSSLRVPICWQAKRWTSLTEPDPAKEHQLLPCLLLPGHTALFTLARATPSHSEPIPEHTLYLKLLQVLSIERLLQLGVPLQSPTGMQDYHLSYVRLHGHICNLALDSNFDLKMAIMYLSSKFTIRWPCACKAIDWNDVLHIQACSMIVNAFTLFNT